MSSLAASETNHGTEIFTSTHPLPLPLLDHGQGHFLLVVRTVFELKGLHGSEHMLHVFHEALGIKARLTQALDDLGVVHFGALIHHCVPDLQISYLARILTLNE